MDTMLYFRAIGSVVWADIPKHILHPDQSPYTLRLTGFKRQRRCVAIMLLTAPFSSSWNFPKITVLFVLVFLDLSCHASDLRRPLVSYNSHLSKLLEKYQHWHELATSTPSSGARYIIALEASSGMGNTIPGVVSAFFLALVTNRTLLLERYNYFLYIDHGKLDFRYSEQVRMKCP